MTTFIDLMKKYPWAKSWGREVSPGGTLANPTIVPGDQYMVCAWCDTKTYLLNIARNGGCNQCGSHEPHPLTLKMIEEGSK
jgi:hypothetical protein